MGGGVEVSGERGRRMVGGGERGRGDREWWREESGGEVTENGGRRARER